MSRPDRLLNDWELDVLLNKLLDVLVDNLILRNLSDLDDRDSRWMDIVSAGHLLVQPQDGTFGCCVAEFLVDVVSAADRAEGEPNAIALHTGRFWLEDLLDSKDLAVGALETGDAPGDGPELRLRANFVGCKDLAAEGWRVRNILSRDWARDDFVVLEHRNGKVDQNRRNRFRPVNGRHHQ